jgi:diacylglycerol kinase family enzyme
VFVVAVPGDDGDPVGREPRMTSAAPGFGERAILLVNRGAGTVMDLSAEAVVEQVQAGWNHGSELESFVVEPESLDATLAQASRDPDIGIVMVAGGDGTISRAARHLVSTEKILAVLPAGTLNVFARELGIPLTLKDALDALANAEVMTIDVGELNGRVFLLHASLGVHPWMVRRRDEGGFSSRATKKMRTVTQLARALWNAPLLRADISVDGEQTAAEARILVVTVGTVDAGLGAQFRRRELAGGRLVLYRSSDERGIGLLRGLVKAAFNPWHRVEMLDAQVGRSIVIDLPHGPAPVALDGEIVAIEPPLHFRVLPRALRVLVPRSAR